MTLTATCDTAGTLRTMGATCDSGESERVIFQQVDHIPEIIILLIRGPHMAFKT